MYVMCFWLGLFRVVFCAIGNIGIGIGCLSIVRCVPVSLVYLCFLLVVGVVW